MNDKQNALEIIRFGKPSHVMTYIPSYDVGYHGANHQGYDDVGMEDGHNRPVGSRWTDIWGTGWHKEYPDVMGFPKIFPLAEVKALRHYKWPDPNDERICSPIYKQAEACSKHGEMFITGSNRDVLWEKSYMLAGMENIMSYFFTEPEYAKEILNKIMDFQLGIAQHYVNVGVEIVGLSDDMGTQHSLLLGKDIFDEFIKPEYKRLFDFYKSKGIIINYHSCGYIEPLLESFIELGVDVLNPVQVTANNLESLYTVTKGRMALMGGISTALIMDGTPAEIRETVKHTINLLGKDGGYFCSPDQGMPFPEENYNAFEEAVKDFGKYPL